MIRLVLERSASTPAVDFDPDSGMLRMSGESYPENTLEFFQPILEWVGQFTERTDNICLDLHMVYMNTSSIKCMLEILDYLELAHKQGKNVTLNWYYDEDNDRALDVAEEFEEDYSMPFNIIPIDDAE